MNRLQWVLSPAGSQRGSLFDMTQEDMLQSMVSIIVEEVRPEQIILFGSRARGDWRADTDVDLMIVETGPFTAEPSWNAELTRLYRRLAGFGVAKALLVFTRDELSQDARSVNHVAAHALREGRLLYECPV